jgi:hypothetical protein
MVPASIHITCQTRRLSPQHDSAPPLCTLNLPFMMSNTDIDRCISCKKSWDLVPRARRRRTIKNVAGQKGDLMERCEPCRVLKNKLSNMPRRERGEEETDPPLPPTKTVSFVAMEEELRLLAQQPDWKACSLAIQGLWDGEEKGIKTIISQLSSLVHEHTGYKFVYLSV